MWFIYEHDRLHFLNSVFAALAALGVSSFANGRATRAGLASGPAHLNDQPLRTTAEVGESASLKIGQLKTVLRWCDTN